MAAAKSKGSTKRRSRRTTKRAAASPWMERLGRLGLVARGALYAVVGVLALQMAMGDRRDETSKEGALSELASRPLGRAVVVVLAVGFAGYAAWRFAQAAFPELDGNDDDGAKGWAKRAQGAVKSALYIVFFLTALPYALGRSEKGKGGEQQYDRAADTVLGLPGGRFVLAAAGLALVGSGVAVGVRALAARHEKQLKTNEMSPRERMAVRIVAAAGQAARMTIFVLAGAFLVRAAWDAHGKEAVGIDGALRKVADTQYGPILLAILAAGLLAFSLFCFAQARWREVLGS